MDCQPNNYCLDYKQKLADGTSEKLHAPKMQRKSTKNSSFDPTSPKYFMH